jgi:hypothetical protein
MPCKYNSPMQADTKLTHVSFLYQILSSNSYFSASSKFAISLRFSSNEFECVSETMPQPWVTMTVFPIPAIISFLIFGTGAWTHGLDLEPLHQPYFYEGIFRIGSGGTICPGWLPTAILPISASWVARITGESHQRNYQFLPSSEYIQYATTTCNHF